MTQHTPGPWITGSTHYHRRGTGKDRFTEHINVTDPSGNPVARVCGFAFQTQLPLDANARLIAAAPDLLAACSAARGMLTPKQQRTWPNNYAKITAAIAKAEARP